jgi:DnaJ-domain-containing protein 1
MSWLDFAFEVASRAAKKLHAEYRAGRDGQPSSTASPRRVAGPSPASAGPPWWEVLGVARGASLAEIIAAFRESIAKNHPDKVAHLSDKLRQVAEQETRRINAAYEEALRILGRKK